MDQNLLQRLTKLVKDNKVPFSPELEYLKDAEIADVMKTFSFMNSYASKTMTLQEKVPWDLGLIDITCIFIKRHNIPSEDPRLYSAILSKLESKFGYTESYREKEYSILMQKHLLLIFGSLKHHCIRTILKNKKLWKKVPSNLGWILKGELFHRSEKGTYIISEATGCLRT